MQSEHKKLLMAFVLTIFVVGMVSALVFKQNTDIDLKIVCINAGFCSSSAVCNVSVFAPNQDILLSGVQATQSPNRASFNITLNSSLTSALGEYSVGGFCKDGSVTQLIDFTFEVTPTGFTDTFNFYVILLLVSTIVIIFGFLVKDHWIILLGDFGLYIGGLFILLNGIVGIKDNTTTFAIAIILLGVATYISVKVGQEVINDG